MLKGNCLSGVVYWVFLLLLPVATFAANDGLTNKEERLWDEAFGDNSTQKTSKKTAYQAPASSGNITGTWVGYYQYDKPKGQPDNTFTAIIKEQGDTFVITFLEPVPNGTINNAAVLGGNKTAKRQGKYIEFTKGYAHNKTEIQYNLTISHDGFIMSGTWEINDNVYGRAFFYKASIENLKAIEAETIN